MIDTDTDVFDVLESLPASGGVDEAESDPLGVLLDLWEAPGIGMGQIRDYLDNLVVRRRIGNLQSREVSQPLYLAIKRTARGRHHTRPFRQTTPEDSQQMRTLRQAGMSVKQIAREIGFSVVSVYKYLRNNEGAVEAIP